MATLMNIVTAENHLSDLKGQFLRENGWASTCRSPGSYWVWIKLTEEYGLLMAPTDLAIRLQSAMKV